MREPPRPMHQTHLVHLATLMCRHRQPHAAGYRTVRRVVPDVPGPADLLASPPFMILRAG
jgi:hypothetical protein